MCWFLRLRWGECTLGKHDINYRFTSAVLLKELLCEPCEQFCLMLLCVCSQDAEEEEKSVNIIGGF